MSSNFPTYQAYIIPKTTCQLPRRCQEAIQAIPILRIPSDNNVPLPPPSPLHESSIKDPPRIICGAGVLVYTNYIYSTFILGAFHAYPEPVAVKLRRAIHYTNVDPQPKNALKYYQQALSVAEELGMDPFSDEILGVKIQVAFMMEKIQKYDKAIEVLEIVRGDCLKWMEKIGGTPGKEGQRTRVLQKTIGMSVKLGELYSSDYIQDPAAAEEKLVWAVTNVLQERLRRENEGVKEGEGDWMSNDEIGAAVEGEPFSTSLPPKTPPPSNIKPQP